MKAINEDIKKVFPLAEYIETTTTSNNQTLGQIDWVSEVGLVDIIKSSDILKLSSDLYIQIMVDFDDDAYALNKIVAGVIHTTVTVEYSLNNIIASAERVVAQDIGVCLN